MSEPPNNGSSAALPRRLWAVTGASGFIGRELVAGLLARGEVVRALVRERPTGTAETVIGDLSDDSSLLELVRGADVVVHLAAYVHRDASSEKDRRACVVTNVDGTRNLVAAIASTDSRPFVVFVSTASVYAPSDAAIDETSLCAPATLYGQTKLEAERIVLDAIERKVFRGCVLRPAVVFGPDAPGNLQRLITMVARRFVLEIGGGRGRKTLVPVQNVIAAILAVASHTDVANGEVYNVGGAVMTMHEIVSAIAAAFGVRPLRVPLPRFAATAAARLADVVVGGDLPYARLAHTLAMNAIILDDKLRALDRYAPVLDVDAALHATVAMWKVRRVAIPVGSQM